MWTLATRRQPAVDTGAADNLDAAPQELRILRPVEADEALEELLVRGLVVLHGRRAAGSC